VEFEVGQGAKGPQATGVRVISTHPAQHQPASPSLGAAGSGRPGPAEPTTMPAAGRRCAGCEPGAGIVIVRLDGPGQRFFSQDSRLGCPSKWVQRISGTKHPSRLAGRQSTRPRPWGRQHCLYLRPEPHQHGPLRGRGRRWPAQHGRLGLQVRIGL
jgi:hypothetical protein